MAVRAEDASAMALPVAHAAMSAVMASRLMARGRPRARTASSERRVSERSASVVNGHERRVPGQNLRVTGSGGVEPVQLIQQRR